MCDSALKIEECIGNTYLSIQAALTRAESKKAIVQDQYDREMEILTPEILRLQRNLKLLDGKHCIWQVSYDDGSTGKTMFVYCNKTDSADVKELSAKIARALPFNCKVNSVIYVDVVKL